MAITIRNAAAPNTVNQQSGVDVSDLGKSRTAFMDRAATVPQSKVLRYRNVSANFTIPLPANVRVHGDIVIQNPSGTEQAAITIGTASAGTQVSAGAAVAAGATNILAATNLQPATAARTLYVQSAAWQAGVDIALTVTEYPPVADTSALS